MTETAAVSVAVETPRHSAVGGLLDYASERTLPPGTLVRVPLGRREVPGIVWHRPRDAAPGPVELRPLAAVLAALPPLATEWRELIDFAAAYYQRGVGELALAVLPPEYAGRSLRGRMLTPDDLDADWRAEIERFRQRPAGQFVLRMYREERLQQPA